MELDQKIHIAILLLAAIHAVLSSFSYANYVISDKDDAVIKTETFELLSITVCVIIFILAAMLIMNN